MEIGQKVQVNSLQDKLSGGNSFVGKVGTIKDFKMTDGSGVGAFVIFDDETSAWFFENELEPLGGGARRRGRR